MLKREANLKGKRKLGVFVTQDNGISIYVALKAHAEIDAARASSISVAMRAGVAGWSIDMATLMKAKARGVKYIVVKLRRKNHMWVTRFDNYMDPTMARLVAKGKSVSRILPLTHFVEASKELKL